MQRVPLVGTHRCTHLRTHVCTPTPLYNTHTPEHALHTTGDLSPSPVGHPRAQLDDCLCVPGLYSGPGKFAMRVGLSRLWTHCMALSLAGWGPIAATVAATSLKGRRHLGPLGPQTVITKKCAYTWGGLFLPNGTKVCRFKVRLAVRASTVRMVFAGYPSISHLWPK